MALTVTLDLPRNLEDRLRVETSHLDAEVTRAYALELFRQGRLSHCELSQVLHLDRLQTDVYLKNHGVFEGSLSMADLEDDTKTLDDLLHGGR